MPLILILKVIAMIVAGLCFYASIFLYEDREKRTQNVLEDLWIKIDDAQTQMLSKHTAFMKAIGSLMTKWFDYIFGNKLVSFQSIGVTLCFSIAWISIGVIVTDIVLRQIDPIIQRRPYSIVTGEQIFSIALGIVYGMLPAYSSHRHWRIKWVSWQKIWGLGLLFILYHEYIGPALYYGYIFLAYGDKPKLVILPILFLLCFAIPMFLFVVFTISLRSSMKRIAQAKSLGEVALTYLNTCVPLLILVLMLRLWLFKLDFSLGLIDLFFVVVIILSIAFNLLFILITTIFVLLALTLLLHRLLWPVLSRPTYALQRYGIAKRSKLLGTIGLLLVYAVFGKFEWLEKLVDKLSPF